MTEVMNNAVNDAFQRDLVYDGGAGKLSKRALLAIGYVAHVMEREHVLGNGETALYWHLVGVAAGHAVATREKPKRRRRAKAAGMEIREVRP